jgi:pilus assembly protein CpaB
MATSRVGVPTLGNELSPRRRRLFVAGVTVAVGAFLLTFLLGFLLLTRSEIAAGDVSVVVANRPIGARQSLTPDVLTLTRYPSRLVPAGAITSVDAAVGKFPQVDIDQNQPLTASLLAASPDLVAPASNQYLPIPQGYVALTIPTSEQVGVAGYISPGDYIDMIATVNTATYGQQPGKQVSKTVLTNVHVIRVGSPGATREATAGGVSSSLTVVVNSCDAEMLNWLAGNASLKYELRSYKDYAPAITAPDPKCPTPGGTSGIGPAQVDGRFGFTKI